MLLEKYEFAGLTEEVCSAFENYHAAQVMDAIRASRSRMGYEYDDVLQRHFQSIAAGEFYMGSNNPTTVKFLGQRKHVEFLVWLLLTANKSDLSAQLASELYSRYKAEIDSFIASEFKKKLPDQSITAESENSSASSNSETSNG